MPDDLEQTGSRDRNRVHCDEGWEESVYTDDGFEGYSSEDTREAFEHCCEQGAGPMRDDFEKCMREYLSNNGASLVSAIDDFLSDD